MNVFAKIKVRNQANQEREYAKVRYVLDHPEVLTELRRLRFDRKVTWWFLLLVALLTFSICTTVMMVKQPPSEGAFVLLSIGLLSFLLPIIFAFRWSTLNIFIWHMEQELRRRGQISSDVPTW